MIQKNLTLTQIYTEYATVTEQLLIKNYEYEHLQNTFKSFMKVYFLLYVITWININCVNSLFTIIYYVGVRK